MLVIFGLLSLKKAQDRGASSWTSMILVCWASAFVFPGLALMGGTLQPVSMLWQPVVVGALFIAGQLFTFLAVHRGDVSIAAPVMGIKVLIVPAGASLFIGEELPVKIWVAAAIAVVGIAFVQARDASIERSRILASVGFALLAACSMTLLDLMIQSCAPAWGAGYFLPIAFASSALLSLLFLSLADRPSELKQKQAMRPLITGSILMAVQAIGMTLTLGLFGDATRVNIVYSLRGLWGVILTWVLAHGAATAETKPEHRTMVLRLVGAMLIGTSVVISVS